jgi:hypothetical protein
LPVVFIEWKVQTVMYLFIDKNGYEAIEKVKTRSEAVQNVRKQRSVDRE